MKEAFARVKDFHSTAAALAFHELFAAMANVYTLELATCDEADLRRKQALLAQCVAFQKSLTPKGMLPKI